MISFVMLVIGFSMLVVGADKFVEGASSLASKLGIPSLIIGLTIVAFGTSAPELAVSITAGLKGSNELVIGNVIGSNMFNLLMVVGACAIASPLTIEKELLNRDWLASIVSAIALVAIIVGGNITRIDGITLLIGFVTITIIQLLSVKKAKRENRSSSNDENEIKPLSNLLMAVYIIVGLAAIILGGEFSVNAATEIARMFNLSETIIGLTVVAMGTSLPELVTCFVATRRGENSIAIGNVVGSNLFNVLLILGVSSTLTPMALEPTALYDSALFLIANVAIFILAKLDRVNRIAGVLLIASYALYTYWIVIR